MNGFWARIHAGFYLLLEEFIDAEALEVVVGRPDRSASVTEALAGCLARLHGVERPEYGPVTGPSRRPCLAYYVDKAVRKLERITDQVPNLSRDGIRRVGRFVQREAERFRAPRAFSLIHGDPSDGNVLVDQENRVTLIDLEYMHFGLPEYDLQMARHYLLRDDESLYRAFRGAYERRRGGPSQEPCRATNLFRVFVLLRSLPMSPGDPATERWRRQWEEIVSTAAP
jgi:aminoglycoside phosphotransferase (APT) family kinase protein